MPHVRTSIRDAIVTALTGLATTGTKVYRTRIYPLGEGKLPGLAIYTNSEANEYLTMGSARVIEKKVVVSVEIYVKAATNYDSTLDQIALEVETALAADVTLSGLATDLMIQSYSSEFNGDGDQPICAGRMEVEVKYHAREGAPGTSI